MNDFSNDPTPAVSPGSAGLIQRAKDILFQPSRTWGVIAAEAADVKSLYLGYIMPLAAIAPIAAAVGIMLFGGVNTGLISPAAVLVGAVFSYVLSLVMVYVLALLVNALAPAFGGQKDFIQALKLVAYSSTAGWIASVVSIVPALGILSIVGALYGLYLMFLGLPRLMKSPSDKSLPYMIVLAILYFVISVIVGMLAGAVTAFVLI